MLVPIITVLLIKSCVGVLESEIPGNLCLDLPGGNAFNGAFLWVWDCIEGSANQNFNFGNSGIGSTANIQFGDGQYCVDAGSDIALGNRLWLWECNAWPQQVFNCDPESDGTCWGLQTQNGYCVNLPRGDRGYEVILAECQFGAEKLLNQAWDTFFSTVSFAVDQEWTVTENISVSV